MTERRKIRVVIAAAGLGTRLSGRDSKSPKCLTMLSGRPLLQRTLESLSAVAPAEVVIVTGFMQDVVVNFVKALRMPFPIRCVENPLYANTGTSKSFLLGIEGMDSKGELLCIEGDVAFDATLLLSLAAGPEASRTVVARHRPGLSGSYVTLAPNRIVEDWVHTSDQERDFVLSKAWKTVNLTLFTEMDVGKFLIPALRATLKRRGGSSPFEYAMRDAIREGLRIAAVDVAQERWFEIDTPADLAVAEEIFRSPST